MIRSIPRIFGVVLSLLAISLGSSVAVAQGGDVNDDSNVNALDVVAVINHFLGSQSWPKADGNGDGSVNALDVVYVINCVLVGGCGGGDLPTQVVGYAEVARISLADLDVPETATVTVASGVADGLTVVDGEIRFITGADTGADQNLTLTVHVGGSSATLPVVVASARPTAISAVGDYDPEDPNSLNYPTLTLGGLGDMNQLTGATPLTLSIDNPVPLDPEVSKINIWIPSTKQVVNLSKGWLYDSQARTLTIPASAIEGVLSTLPASEMELDITINSVDDSAGGAYEVKVFKAVAALSGKIVDPAGNPVTTLAGRLVGIRGLENQARLVTPVDGNGHFQASHLMTGPYQVSLLDTAAPGFTATGVYISPETTIVNVSLVYTPPAAPIAYPQIVRPPWGVVEEHMVPCSIENPADSYMSGQLVIHTCQFPKGIKRILFAFSHGGAYGYCYGNDEPPCLTDDFWTLSCTGDLPGLPSGLSGRMSDLGVDTAGYYPVILINVPDSMQQKDLKIQCLTSSIVADNCDKCWGWGDEYGPRPVGGGKVLIATSPTQGLMVRSATFKSPNTRPYRVINDVRNFISVPISARETAWGIPLEVRFVPKDATLTKVEIGLVVNGEVIMAAEDILQQDHTVTRGRTSGIINFRNLILPVFPVSRFDGDMNVVIKLTGTVGGDSEETDPREGIVKAPNSQSTTFTPLFLANDVFANRRYGTRDAGGDSWATYQTIAWLQGKPYRFDDISALHVAKCTQIGPPHCVCPPDKPTCNVIGRSALGHGGHNNGAQIDMRYADGSGGFTDAMGGETINEIPGKAIRDALNAARQEMNSIAPDQPKPNLALIIRWITDNRALAEQEAIGSRRLHMGDAWMRRALEEGRFSNGTIIPSVETWDATTPPTAPPSIGAWTEPTQVTFPPQHLSHWHLSLIQ